jgi:sterol desaturase/sphingolipid hydroxylase (fatty acid hydroxylase superfamily)
VIQALSTIVWLALLIAIFVPLERLFAVHAQPVWRKGMGRDLAYYFLNALIPALLLGVPAALFAMASHRILPEAWFAFVGGWPLWLRLAAALIVADFGAYWGHRLSHASPLLWRFHAVHHAAPQMDWLVNTRAHPLDLVFVRVCGLATVHAVGLASAPAAGGPDVVSMLVIIWGTIWGFFVHANLRWRFGLLEWLVSTPAFHHWHHVLEGPVDRNFAATFPIWDRLFGTLWLPAAWPESYGTPTPVSDGLLEQLLTRPPSGGERSHSAENGLGLGQRAADDFR